MTQKILLRNKIMSDSSFKLLVSGTAPILYPADTFFGLLYYEADEALEIPKKYPYQGEWGLPVSTHLMEREDYPMPWMIDIVWLSIVERKYYSLVKKLPTEKLEDLFRQKDKVSGNPVYEHIVIGMAPYGGVALWTYGFKKSTTVAWMHAEETQVEMNDFMPLNPDVSLDDNCDFFINNDSRVKEELMHNGFPPLNLYDNYMCQFTYRYLPLFEHWDNDEGKWTKYTEEEKEKKTVFDYVEEALYDGTHDKMHDDSLMKYHEAGKPKKLALQWHILKSEYSAYFWFEDEQICTVFNRFYGPHPDTKTDLIIRIDVENNKYELALYRYGLKEPYVIDESAYQLIVFKNKFECFRSENYDQPHGAWVW
jgi:hypothetical protein